MTIIRPRNRLQPKANLAPGRRATKWQKRLMPSTRKKDVRKGTCDTCHGKIDEKKEILKGLDRPYGLAFWKDYLYVAETTSLKRYKYNAKTFAATAGEEVLGMKDFGAGHWTRSLAVDKKGEKIYVEGEIEYRQWTDKENQTRYTTEIRVRELMLLGGRPGGASDDMESGAQRRSPAPARSKPAGAAAAPAGGDDFSDFPGALEDEDDDLPF